MNANILKDDFRFLGVSATAALCFGLLFNQFRDEPLALSYQSKEVRLGMELERLATRAVAVNPNDALPEKLSLDDFSVYVFEKKGVILDARPEIFYRQGHIPGAFNLPREDFENGYRVLNETLERDRSQPIAIYCASLSCKDAELVRKALTTLGYTQLAVFEGGWTEWTNAGKPEKRD